MTATAAFSTLDEWLPWLETLSPREIVLGLERVEAMLEKLGISRPDLVVTIAGTNGKGSSVAMLAAILAKDGMRIGCYTSPHISRYNERIRIDGHSAPDEAIIAAFERIESSRGDIPLTFFEFGTLAALLVFEAAKLDAWILEVGMGGRLDAVNALTPDVSLITNIGLDHCAWLGDDRESIAAEKAGIMREGVTTVFGSADMPKAISACALRTGAVLLAAGRDFSFTVGSEGRWSWQGQGATLENLQRPSLAGDVQLQNAAAVLALIEALGKAHLLTQASIDDALTGLELAGRFQVIDVAPRWILDVAHNPDAGKVLASQLRAHAGPGKLTAVVGMLADKDVEAFISPLAPLVDDWIAVSIAGSRGGAATPLAQKIANCSSKPCLIVDDMQQAFDIARERSMEDDTVLVTGSFYIVGPALDWLSGLYSRRG
jgi:dihydrofolate synthase/folylpolyglutamate synthase